MVCFSFFLALLATASSALPFNSREDNAWLTLQAIDSFLFRYIGPEVDNWNGSLQGILVFDRDAATVYVSTQWIFVLCTTSHSKYISASSRRRQKQQLRVAGSKLE